MSLTMGRTAAIGMTAMGRPDGVFFLESRLHCRSAFFRPLLIYAAVGIAYFDLHGQAFAPHFHGEFVTSVNTKRYERIRRNRTSLEAGRREVALYHPDPVQCS
ncbi:hypothetical protein [Comamonas terrigena]|uniref:hypothetical protein n=1 Tax=Comamonas terrigena TaxID=32013 RepID=UPI00244702AB|nr:hypothetical protein [Comamonas terrigena]MDH1701704.1 hypothetical protein [Comamonas terrigena]